MRSLVTVFAFNGAAILVLLVLRLVFLRLAKLYQSRYGYSNQAITDLSIVLPIAAFIVVFVTGMSWLSR